ncbi:acetylxylan esterase [Rathayibacter sp. ZW T2_19]|uniref:Acetylxylan esterase n=1 Tax=Rathayibacter rubneri TaxID=2950106 RepID=A0A9X2IT26_9MICO|nr:acetylxylan esterase [Rathayibacter rubneri]MCM6761204.1 acetylxylan esterase [Rathayibacter rubneri]
MPLTDLALDQLEAYSPDVAEPSDFDDFWGRALAESRASGGSVVLSDAQAPFSAITVTDMTFPGFGGEPIRAWLSAPAGAQGPLPTVIEYNGYNGGRGVAGEKLLWAAAGYAHLFMDTRGQGSGWGTGGDTPDPSGSGPATAGFMTRGVLDPEQYYYRRLFTDAVRLIDAAADLDVVDAGRIAVAGASQGGGIALAAAALHPLVRAVMPDVPFLCHFRRAVDVCGEDPFAEIKRYLAVHRRHEAAVFSTLSYFDGANFARRATAPALFSVALMDDIVPPSTVYAAYNRYRGPKRIEVYPFNGHEGGQTEQWHRQAEWLPAQVARPGSPRVATSARP